MINHLARESVLQHIAGGSMESAEYLVGCQDKEHEWNYRIIHYSRTMK